MVTSAWAQTFALPLPQGCASVGRSEACASADGNASLVGPFAALDSSVLSGINYNEFLTPRERRESVRFRTYLRRNEWLAARLASKFLFLTGHSGALGVSDLHRFPPATYRDIEVTRDDRTNFGRPQVRRGGECRDLAISHSDGIACAVLGVGETIAVDIERVQPRGETFYRGNFTERERARADEYFTRLGLNRHWTLMLLWSIKECLLKTPAYNELSVWDMPSIDLRIVAGGDDLARAHAAPTLLHQFVFLIVEAASRKGTELRRVAVSGWHGRVITVIRGGDRRTV
jgi:phosphopantetheinyl transferase (holo-ACP synthase)